MMHVVHVVQLYHPVTSGSVRYFVELADRLVAAGHRVTVLTTTAGELEAFWLPGKREYPAGTDVYRGTTIVRCSIRRWSPHPLVYPVLRRLILELGRVGAPVRLLRWLSAATPAAPDIAGWIHQHSAAIDLIHVTNVTLDGLIHPVLTVAAAAQIPVVATPFIHLGVDGDTSLVRYYRMPQQLDVLRQSRAVFTMTDRERDFLVQQGISPAAITTTGAGVTPADVTGGDALRFRTAQHIDGPIVLQIGAMARDKGTFTTIAAMQRLWAAGSPATLVLIGAPLDHFSHAYATLPAADRARVRLLSHASDDDKRDALAAASLLTLPSRTDSFGIVFLEAWCNHIPVIGAAAGGIPAVISDGVDGILVPYGDVGALAHAIERLLADPGTAALYAAAGAQKVADHYTWDAIGARMVPVCVAAAHCDD